MGDTMFNKIYSKVKQFIKENLFFIILPIIVVGTLSYPLPYYVEAPGGIINLNGKVNVKNGYKERGSLNITYVSSYNGNIGTYLITKLNKSWDLVPSSNVEVGIETRDDVLVRNKILLENSLSNAYYVAYTHLNKEMHLSKPKIQVLFITENADTNIKTGDVINKIDDVVINNTDDILKYLSTKNIGDKLKVIVNEKEEKYIKVGTLNGTKSLNISVICNYDYNDDVEFKFTNGESGPSGGLMISLSIYNQNTKEDITKGKKVAGTGTIDLEGNVGEIGGIKHKIAGAAKEKVDLFLLPYENYEEAKEVVKTYNYNIKLVPVKTFDEAVEYLKNN